MKVFIKVMNGLVMTLEEDKRFLRVWLLNCVRPVVCSVTWPLNASEAGVDLDLSAFSFKCQLVSIRTT